MHFPVNANGFNHDNQTGVKCISVFECISTLVSIFLAPGKLPGGTLNAVKSCWLPLQALLLETRFKFLAKEFTTSQRTSGLGHQM